MEMKFFTLDEAESLLPVLESLLRTSIEGKQVIESLEAEYADFRNRVFLNGGMTLDVVFTPGHSPGHVTYAVTEATAPEGTAPDLFSGDVLFQASIGVSLMTWLTASKNGGCVTLKIPDAGILSCSMIVEAFFWPMP